MTRIDAADQLAAMLRAQIAPWRRDSDASPKAADASPNAQPADATLLTAARIRGIPADDPLRRQKALRAFLECVLLSELGDTIALDPAFVRMVDHVMHQFRADPKLSQAASKAADALLASAARRR